jgi:heavy metal response regulator
LDRDFVVEIGKIGVICGCHSVCLSGSPVRILLVEDDRKVASFIQKGLAEEGYAVDLATDGEMGLAMGLDRLHDVIVLDVMLPGKPGFQVLRELRQARVETPVLLLTARDTVEDKVRGLDAGADDYLTKPFAFAELLARVRALLRRRTAERAPLLKVEDLVLDPATRAVKRGSEAIPLTNREFSLLEYLMRNAGRVLTRTAIAEHVWDYSFDSETNVIDVYVNYLRKKIDTGRDRKLIHTVRGVGYVLKAD